MDTDPKGTVFFDLAERGRMGSASLAIFIVFSERHVEKTSNQRPLDGPQSIIESENAYIDPRSKILLTCALQDA